MQLDAYAPETATKTQRPKTVRQYVQRLARSLLPSGHQLPKQKIDFSVLPALLGTQSPTILEIGANDGADSFRFLQVLPNAQLYCFEPDERAACLWRQRMAGTSAVLVEAAVGAHNGETAFHVSGGTRRNGEDWHRSSSIHQPTGHLAAYPDIQFDRTATVPIVRLDDWSTQNGINHVDFLWADIQGAEGDMIAGGRQTLSRTRILHTEYSDTEMYASQITLDGIRKELASFVVLAQYRAHVLMVNAGLRS